MKESLVITTGIGSSRDLEEQALLLSTEIDVPYIKREKNSLADIREQTGRSIIWLVRKEKLSLSIGDQELFFHPGLAKLRIKDIQVGKTDQMIKAMNLGEGNSVLDCTLGLAADALVASFVTGEKGKVVGVEDSLPVAELVRRGLKTYTGEKPGMLQAMRRIRVVHDNHLNYLRGLDDNSFDVVYFDPMFRSPREQSSSISPLRPLANQEAVDKGAIEEAFRVAKHRVVMKENRFSQEFKRLNFHSIVGGRYSPIAYGVMVKGCGL